MRRMMRNQRVYLEPFDPSLALPAGGEGTGYDLCCISGSERFLTAADCDQRVSKSFASIDVSASFSPAQAMYKATEISGIRLLRYFLEKDETYRTKRDDSPPRLRGRGWGWGLTHLTLFCFILFTLVSPLAAQQTPIEPTPTTATALDATAAPQQFGSVTFDDVNRVAGGMYCPECEYIPLDKCYSPVCVQWKDEIAVQLAEGRTDQQIIDGFVARFGDQVLGIPQDQNLRNLSIYIPYILLVVIVIGGVLTFLRWNRRRPAAVVSSGSVEATRSNPDADRYRSQLERDLDA